MEKFVSIAKAKKSTGLSYLGKVNNSTKHEKAYKYNELVYTLYLAPADSSGHEVCAGRSASCTKLCLDKSGQNLMNAKIGRIDKSRIKKTKLFFENRPFFMAWMCAEIELARNTAKRLGYRFSVRLNNTSDLSPEIFRITGDNGKSVNILQLFPHVTFYDYTKVFPRLKIVEKYPNYDLTFSYSGENLEQCEMALSKGFRVAMVFDKLPETYMGKTVIDGDQYDMRYLDPKDVVVGLKFKKVRNKPDASDNFLIKTL